MHMEEDVEQGCNLSDLSATLHGPPQNRLDFGLFISWIVQVEISQQN